MSNFTLSYASDTKIIKVPNRPVFGSVEKALYDFGASILTEIELSKFKAKISLQDLHLMFQIITYANHNIANEYVKKLENID
jgi:hypothetical protein